MVFVVAGTRLQLRKITAGLKESVDLEGEEGKPEKNSQGTEENPATSNSTTIGAL